MKRIEFNRKWYSFYGDLQWWNFEVSPATYFDDRWAMHFMVTNALGILLLPFFGLNIFTFLLLFIPWGKLYIHFPIYSEIDDSDYPSYGFYFYHPDGVGWERACLWDSFWIRWGKKSYCFNMPWAWDWVRTSNLREDGTWEHEYRHNRKDFYLDKWKGFIKYETFPYTYTLKKGTVQNRLATVKTEEREWRWRAFKWLPWPRMIRRTINIDFDGEVGERTGSWKGGTVGCGWDLLKGETPEQALRRMEATRKFN